jgi:hypothetical protein
MYSKSVTVCNLHISVWSAKYEDVFTVIRRLERSGVGNQILASTLNFTSTSSSRLHGHFSLAFSFSLNFVRPWPLFQFFNPIHSRRTPLTGDQPVARPIHTQTQIKLTQTSMPWVGFEPTIPAFEGAKTVQTSDPAVTVIGWNVCNAIWLASAA